MQENRAHAATLPCPRLSNRADRSLVLNNKTLSLLFSSRHSHWLVLDFYYVYVVSASFSQAVVRHSWVEEQQQQLHTVNHNNSKSDKEMREKWIAPRV